MNGTSGNSLIRALRGPVMLIAVGALFQLSQADVISITKSWPAILILFGIFSLAERSAPSGDRSYSGGAQ